LYKNKSRHKEAIVIHQDCIDFSDLITFPDVYDWNRFRDSRGNQC
jgi:hypothetical protein